MGAAAGAVVAATAGAGGFGSAGGGELEPQAETKTKRPTATWERMPGTLPRELSPADADGCKLHPMNRCRPPRRLLAFAACLALVLACGERRRAEPPRGFAAGAYVARLAADARAIGPLARSELGRRFLATAEALPPITPRRVGSEQVDEGRYYDGDIAAPLHYLPALDVASANGLTLGPGARIVDFGYGAIGQLRMLASLGFDVTGVEVKPALLALYSAPGDTGVVPPAAAGGRAGRLRVLGGFFPTDGALVAAIGGDYDLFVSKNTLKKGYIHPDRPAPDSKLVHLGVDDATFLGRVAALLRPGGSVLLYNVFVPTPEGEPFQPMSDGRCPFPREAWEAAGFRVTAFDVDDAAAMRAVLAATLHPEDGDDPSIGGRIQALYTFATLARRPD
jgi:hypothetical protein